MRSGWTGEKHAASLTFRTCRNNSVCTESVCWWNNDDHSTSSVWIRFRRHAETSDQQTRATASDVRTRGHRTKGHQAGFLLQFLFQLKCTSFRKYSSCPQTMYYEINWQFLLLEFIMPSLLYLFFGTQWSDRVLIKRCGSIVPGLTSHAEGPRLPDTAWDCSVLA